MKIKIGHDSMFNVSQINFKSAHLLHEMARGYIKSGAKKNWPQILLYSSRTITTSARMDDKRSKQFVSSFRMR